uniref:Uncharacterized protein n=1 Tax=Romanomermis culicivorax TaxID=13658 RepID=A0A915KRB5_ROMCU
MLTVAPELDYCKHSTANFCGDASGVHHAACLAFTTSNNRNFHPNHPRGSRPVDVRILCINFGFDYFPNVTDRTVVVLPRVDFLVKEMEILPSLIIFASLSSIFCEDEVYSCGGFIVSSVPINFVSIK